MNVSRTENAVDLTDVVRRVGGDPWIRVGLGLLAVQAVPFLLPASRLPALLEIRTFVVYWAPFLFLLLWVPLYARAVRQAKDLQELKFWRDLQLALWVWISSYVPRMVDAAVDIDDDLYRLIQVSIYSIVYILQLMAAERQPHRLNVWRPRGLERTVTVPALVVLLLGLTAYFVLIPTFVRPDSLDEEVGSFPLYFFFDVVLLSRFLYLSRRATALRWRAIYGSYSLVAFCFLVSNFVEWHLYKDQNQPAWTHPLDSLWPIAFFVVGLTPVIGRLRFAARSAHPGVVEPWHGALAGSSRVTLLWALIIPLSHIALYQFGLLAESTRAMREDLVLGLIVVLGTAALIQQRVLEGKTVRLWEERQEVERSLRASENDLRLMIERNKTAERVAAEEEKFAKAFRAHHDGLAISTLDEGLLVDVNPSFERITGFRRDDVVGRTAHELWARPEDRRRVVAALVRHGYVRHIETEIPRADGTRREVVASFELLYDREHHYMMTVLHDIDASQSEIDLRAHAALLDDAQAAILCVDPDGRIDYLNAAARRLLMVQGDAQRRRLEDLADLEEDDNLRLRRIPLAAGDGNGSGDGETGADHGGLLIATHRTGDDSASPGAAR